MMDIKKYRKEKGLNQEDIAKVLGVSQASYSYKEVGKRRFNIEELKALKKILQVSYEELLGD